MGRRKADTYPSEPSMVQALLARQRITGRVFEPAAGEGMIALELEKEGIEVVRNDIAFGHFIWRCDRCGSHNMVPIHSFDDAQDDCKCRYPCRNVISYGQAHYNCVEKVNYHCDFYEDATKRDVWEGAGHIDWVVTNPPFSELDMFLDRAFYYAKVGVAMILRITALEPAVRRNIRGGILMAYEDNMRYLMPFSAPRPSFTGDGKTDSVTTAWFVWDKNFSWNAIGIRPPFQFLVDWKYEEKTTSEGGSKGYFRTTDQIH